MNRFFGSLHFKMAFAVITTIVVISSVYFVVDYRSNRRQFLGELHKSAHQLSTVSLQSLLELAMLGRHPELLQSAIERQGSGASIDRILLMDRSGLVRFSSNPEDLGRQYNLGQDGCRNCHTGQGTQTPTSELLRLGGVQVLRTVSAVPNRQECHVCHDAGQENNGILVIDYSTAEIESRLRTAFYESLYRAGLMILAILIVLGVLMHKLVLFPIARLSRATTHLKEGKKPPGPDIHRSRDEIGKLANSFSAMAEQVQNSIRDLRSQRAYLQDLINGLPDGLIVVGKDLKAEMTNQAADRIWNRDQLARILAEDGPYPDLVDVVRRTDKSGELDTCQIKLEPADGSTSLQETLFLEIYCSPLNKDNEQAFNTILLVRDITRRKMFEAQVSRADRLASVGQLAAGFAHEINNPLAAITTSIEGLSRHVTASGEISELEKTEIRDYLSTVEEAASRCKNITQRLLTASVERGPANIACVDLREILRDAVDLFRGQAKRQGVLITVGWLPQNDRFVVMGNGEKLSQLVVNLLLNSLEATPGGGKIDVSLFRQDRFTCLKVADSGCGIPEDQLESIFDPFFTTKTEGRGTGLGLSISQWIVRQHQARMEVQSRVGEGTTFSVLFPSVEEGVA